jgi:hypothetical protein
VGWPRRALRNPKAKPCTAVCDQLTIDDWLLEHLLHMIKPMANQMPTAQTSSESGSIVLIRMFLLQGVVLSIGLVFILMMI